jgi:RHS repeat-associated protein
LVTNNLRFAGQYEDIETGLYYNRLRFYDSNIGRYLKTDPICLKGGINLYSYSLEDPINRYDPFGLFGDGTKKGKPHKGHSDFSGSDKFDYAKEDHGLTGPLWPWSMWRHFRSMDDVLPEQKAAITKCDKNSFERLMHQGQDTFFSL